MASFQQITLEQAKALLQEDGTQVIDIRDAMSFQAGRIQGAERIDNQNLPAFMSKANKDKPLIVCCYHGNSSQGAAQFFADQGFEQALSLKGGYEMWKLGCPDLCEI
ncbi:MAG: thiosulfate sulfurtransferase GlpE [Oceanobacter sp.]